jgi:RNA polymerase sigma factor (TIGR02999 family)
MMARQAGRSASLDAGLKQSPATPAAPGRPADGNDARQFAAGNGAQHDAQQPTGEVTLLLRAWAGGDPAALSRLVPLVYGELRRLAERRMAAERGGHTLQATALVHEAYLRLAGSEVPRWQDRVHFFAIASRVMRRLLVDHARARRCGKRGGGADSLALAEALAVAEAPAPAPAELLALDQALTTLAELSPRQARVVELRFFGGMTLEETAAELGVSTTTVIVEARLGRAWLYRRLSGGGTRPQAATRPQADGAQPPGEDGVPSPRGAGVPPPGGAASCPGGD